MAYLSDTQLAHVQTFFDTAEARLSEIGLTLDVDDDLSNWVGHMKQSPGILNVAATHDPAFSYIHPGNAFWMRFENASGRIVACIAHKVVVTENLIDEVRSHRIFFDRRPILHHYPVNMCIDANVPQLSGRIDDHSETFCV